MQSIFEIIYHFLSGCTYCIKTGVYYLASVPSHISHFWTGINSYFDSIPIQWRTLITFSLVSSIALFFMGRSKT